MPDAVPDNSLIERLLHPSVWPFPVASVELRETHISWVLLTGDFAYKIKKPVDFGFLDFSTLEKRRLACLEEVRLNRRLAAAFYLGVVPITGSATAPRPEGAGEPIEFAVKMRRFPSGGLLSERAEPLGAELIDGLAETLAHFHAAAAVAAPESRYGAPEQVFQPMRENFPPVRAVVREPAIRGLLDELEQWTRRRFGELRGLLMERRRQGRVREGHGDLHLGNITLTLAGPLIFDAIEFNPDLRWIDTLNDLAFLVMDLEERGEATAAARLLNAYLERSGDYEGLPLLPFYQCYRAMVRAKVAALRLAQSASPTPDLATQLQGYLEQAAGYTRPSANLLLITHGPSGSGKSFAAAEVAEHLPAIRIRSDVERKRLAGLTPDARTGSGPGAGIYGRDATRATYGRLLHLADAVVEAGYSVVVDATFLRREQRRPFREMAACLGIPFVILDMRTPDAVMRQRIRKRLDAGRDPSEADESILARQLAEAEPLDEAESGAAVAQIPDAQPPIGVLRRLLYH